MHDSGSGPHGGSGAQTRGTHHARTAREREERVMPLVGVPLTPRNPLRDIGRLDLVHIDARPRDTDADVDQFDLAAQRGTAAQKLTGLQRHEGDGARRRPRTRDGETGEAINARRDVDSEHRYATRGRRGPVPAESGAVRRVDDEVARREPRGHIRRVKNVHPHSLVGQKACGHTAIGTVAPLADDHHDRAAVDPAEHSSGCARDCRARTGHEHLDGCSKRDGLGVDDTHLSRAEHGPHGEMLRPFTQRRSGEACATGQDGAASAMT